MIIYSNTIIRFFGRGSRRVEGVTLFPFIILMRDIPAHGSPVTAPKDRTAAILSWRKKRVNDVMDVISAAGKDGVSLKGILFSLYPDESKVKHDFARGWVELTLEKLVSQGLILRGDDKRYRVI